MPPRRTTQTLKNLTILAAWRVSKDSAFINQRVAKGSLPIQTKIQQSDRGPGYGMPIHEYTQPVVTGRNPRTADVLMKAVFFRRCLDGLISSYRGLPFRDQFGTVDTVFQ